jgi:crotonobetainyl-CoA:carnitine CoA-transferase CaiB-like acyl-CoA transferase
MPMTRQWRSPSWRRGFRSIDMTALYLAVAILATLNKRHASNLCQHIIMSLLDVQVTALSNLGMGYLVTGVVPQRLGNRLSTAYPSDSFRCADGDRC